jgi:hypothetical protein
MPGRAVRTLAAAAVFALVATCGVISFGPGGASAAVTKGVKPDFVLTPKAKPVSKSYTSVLVNDLTVQAKGNGDLPDAIADAFIPTPDDCRTPAYDTVCDVYRIKLNRNLDKEALNVVIIEMDWTGVLLPDLVLVVAGLGIGYLPDIDMFLYANPKRYLPLDEVGGRSVAIPERLGFTATQDEYDLVIRASTGVATQYRLTAYMSDELFGKPFEILDDVLTGPHDVAPVDSSAPTPLPAAPPANSQPLELAPIDVDSAIGGIGLGVREQFDPQALSLNSQTRSIAASAKPPSALALVVGMLAVPLLVATGVVAALRRRRNAMAL